MLNDEDLVIRCITLAKKAFDSGDSPFGALIAKDGKILVEATNAMKIKKDITLHAEIIAIRKAQKKLQTDDLTGYTLYSSCEPCPMCSFMAREAKFSRVIFSLYSPQMGGFSKWKILQDEELSGIRPFFSDVPEIKGGVSEDKSIELLGNIGWFDIIKKQNIRKENHGKNNLS